MLQSPLAMPKFRDIVAWQQAEILMQPAFIRLIDNIRKQLEESVWTGTYEDIEVWAEGISDETKFRVKQLQAELENAPPDQAPEIEAALAHLPAPYPGYQLRLEHQGHQVTFEVWSLCYQICFQDYDTASGTSQSFSQAESQGVTVDPKLLDATGDIDWDYLDQKTRQLVEQIFATLPS
ncbi:hypothetical protein K9N68_02105 [Kovacikia minuta CCNUW1]|uniref:hypothetical protein n=1 Tax=Kovacikia minuta TaxID=2931930 RepID=UPI001CD00215|nr:hypothetical protein [Kovacikia minuta]UBF26811.1 hypothetical protein K9N68_02105 [Kovacikia minuta CCNUW1]